MSQRISACFDNAKKAGSKVLIPFITAGDPDPDWTVAIMHALVDAGSDLIELGVPFSDPMADGPVIQLASERAIEKNVTLAGVLTMVKDFRQKDVNTPVSMVCCWWTAPRKNAMTWVLPWMKRVSMVFAW